MRSRLFLPALMLPIILACAPLQQADASSLTPEQSSLIDATCSRVMGLTWRDYYFLQCQDSLAHSMARKLEAEASATAYDNCRSRGLTDAALSVCALDAQNAAERGAAVPRPVDLSAAAAVLHSGKKYFDVSSSVQFQRVRYSCAQLGLMPNSGLFGTCVASLEGALFPSSD